MFSLSISASTFSILPSVRMVRTFYVAIPMAVRNGNYVPSPTCASVLSPGPGKGRVSSVDDPRSLSSAVTDSDRDSSCNRLAVSAPGAGDPVPLLTSADPASRFRSAFSVSIIVHKVLLGKRFCPGLEVGRPVLSS